MTASEMDLLCINTIRTLAIDAIQKAKSGHPGTPMGMADIATVLFGQFLKFDAAAPDWPVAAETADGTAGGSTPTVITPGHVRTDAIDHPAGSASVTDHLRKPVQAVNASTLRPKPMATTP